MIFHFTKLSSLLGILDSQELFLGNCNQMNDPLDRTFGIDCLRSYVRNGGKYSQKLKGTLSDADIEKALKMSLKIPYYAVSFSKGVNNSTLWENYADNYKGVAIGFDERQLVSAIDDIIQHLDAESFTQKSFLELKMITYGYRCDVIDSLVENYNDNSVNEKIHLAFFAYKLCGMIKSEKGANGEVWANEEEYRLLFKYEIPQILSRDDAWIQLERLEKEATIEIFKNLGLYEEQIKVVNGKYYLPLKIGEIIPGQGSIIDHSLKCIYVSANNPDLLKVKEQICKKLQAIGKCHIKIDVFS